MLNMIFLQCVPHDLRFQWEIEVQITNFRKFGISSNMHILVWYPKNSDQIGKWMDIQRKYPEINLFFYVDEGVNLALYIPSLRPHTIKKHFKKYPELEKVPIFYHDSDIIFNFLPPFEDMIKDNICWQSNTSSYLDYVYLVNKEKQGNIKEGEVVQLLADIGGITASTIEEYSRNTGGAQCMLKGVDTFFWEDVETQCTSIRKALWWNYPNSVNKKYFKNEQEGFQSWTADMWALNFSLWKRGKVTQVTKDLDFSWATDSIDNFERKPIYHNAGASRDRKDIFFKGEWVTKSPLHRNLVLPEESKASRKYVELINEVKIIW